jgi:predicted PurR-regulated permease PerM
MNAPLLQVAGLTKRFGGIAAVNNVSFDLHAGRIVGLIGPNGAGKTTLVNLITGVHRASAGSILFNGEDVTGQRPFESALRGLSRTFQIVQPFPKMTVLDNVDTISGWIKLASNLKGNEPPSWLVSLPVVGPRAASFWADLVEHGAEPLLGKVMPYVGTFAGRVLKEAGLIGSIGVQFLLSVLLCAVLYAYGEDGARAVLRFARRLAGDQGVRMTRLAAASVRGVALGVVVTAVVQSVLAGLGLALVGVPAVALLTALMFLLALAQIGVIPVLLPAVIWLYWSGQIGWAIGLLIWTVVVSTLDNVMRPWLIKKGADLPFLLIFVGVVGGLIAFGLIGMDRAPDGR